MADRKNWLVSENDHSDGWVGAEGSKGDQSRLRVTQVGAELRAEGGLTFLTAGASASGIPFLPHGSESEAHCGPVCVTWPIYKTKTAMGDEAKLQIWDRLRAYVRSGVFPVDWFLCLWHPQTSSKGAGQVLAEGGAFCSPPPPFFKQAHHASHRAKWVKSTIKSLLGICYPKALCNRKYF